MKLRLAACASAVVLVIVFANPSRALAATTLDAAQQMVMLEEHNRWRAVAGVPALRWSDELADSARRWADALRASRNCLPAHSADPSRGENLFWAGAVRWSDGRVERQAITPGRVVSSWAEERRLYDTVTGRCRPGSECGHYTQLVWRHTSELGCGMAACADLSQIWVCHYRPAGNLTGRPAF
jgi:pathogenesis-related protein 1